MTPAEIADLMIGLGICYQVKFPPRPSPFDSLLAPPQTESDFSSEGYNKDKQTDDPSIAAKEEDGPPPIPKGKIIRDKEELLRYDGWHLADSPPKESPKTWNGPHISAYIYKGRFFIKGDDIPWHKGAMKYSCNIEYIKDIRYQKNSRTLIIETTLGPLGFMIPE